MAIGSNTYSFMYDAVTGTLEDGWPHGSTSFGSTLSLPMVGEGHPAPLALADVDGDGDLEIADPIAFGVTNPLHHDATEAFEISYVADDFGEDSSTNVSNLLPFNSFPAWGDLDQDGTPDLVNAGLSTIHLASLGVNYLLDYQVPVVAWSGKTGDIFPGWPRQIEDVHIFSGFSIADVSGDGIPEVILGSAGFLVHAWDFEGNQAPGFPKFTGNWIQATPTVGDIDGDGYLDVVVGTRDGLLFAWSTRGHADQKLEWNGSHHDLQNTSNYGHPIPTQKGPPLEPDLEEEGCCSDNSDEKNSLLLLPIALLAIRRRRNS
jgi:hypothetical protein